MSRHLTVPVFIPHEGCTHCCSFCNQKSISGVAHAPSVEEVRTLFLNAQQSLGERMHNAELAFFGGSFTAINESYRVGLLEAAMPFVGPSGFRGVRVSTRPDCIDRPILGQLKHYQVTTIELGVQSMSDKVLCANRRGHLAEDTKRASSLILQYGFSLGHQMMTGLYGDDTQTTLDTARQIIALKPDMVRIYPTMVLEETPLARLWRDGAYTPQTLEQAVALGATLLELFAEAGVPVIRLGLHDEAGLSEKILAGPHHPALRELCEGKLLLARALQQINTQKLKPGSIQLLVHPTAVSKMVGQKKCNLAELQQRGYRAAVIGQKTVPPMSVQVAALQ